MWEACAFSPEGGASTIGPKADNRQHKLALMPLLPPAGQRKVNLYLLDGAHFESRRDSGWSRRGGLSQTALAPTRPRIKFMTPVGRGSKSTVFGTRTVCGLTI